MCLWCDNWLLHCIKLLVLYLDPMANNEKEVTNPIKGKGYTEDSLSCLTGITYLDLRTHKLVNTGNI